MEYVESPAKQVEVAAKADVAVFGAGLTGVVAAVAAARMGARTVLVERWPFLGGMATVVPVSQVPIAQWLPVEGQEHVMAAGVPLDLAKQMIDRGKWTKPEIVWSETRKAFGAEYPDDSVRFWEPHFGFDHEYLKYFLIEFCEKDNVDLIVMSTCCDVIMDGDKIKAVEVANKSGRQAVIAEAFVDCTGDGDLAAFAGAPYEYVPFHTPEVWGWQVANVDTKVFKEYEKKDPNLKNLLVDMIKKGLTAPWNEKNPLYFRCLRSGFWDQPFIRINEEGRVDVRHGFSKPRPALKGTGNVGFNCYSRADTVSGRGLSTLELSARKDQQRVMDYINENVPGFKDAYILGVNGLGIRESRRIIGEYLLTREDIVKGRKHYDSIGQSCWDTMGTEKSVRFWKDMTYRNPVYDIPWRCLVPRNVENLLVAGRCFSVDTPGYFSDDTRDLNTCEITGQGAGVGAALAAREKAPVQSVDVREIQKYVKRYQYRYPHL